jgi:BASS family bile acid:Na+ symporter
MFGVALDMKVADFKRIIEYPRSVAVGLTSQLLVLPILTVLLIKVWGPAPSMALGLILIAACPGGNISNYAVHLGKGNTALSVTMTSIITLSAFVLTPLSFALWSKLIPETQPILQTISVSPLDMVRIILQLIVVPLAAGMWLNRRYSSFTDKIKKPIRRISLLLFASFIFFAVFGNRANIAKYLHLVFLLVVVHNIIALVAGYTFARLNRRSLADSKAICMETGIQNAGLGLIIILNFFGDYGGMMLVAAFWGVWDLASAFGLALFWRYRSSAEEIKIAVSEPGNK